MALREILTDGAPTLRKTSRPVTKFDDRLATLLDDMYETMAAADGVGLAAPQVGILRRVIVIDIGEGKIELVNPEVVEAEGEQEMDEGCLSIPGMRGRTVRPQRVKVAGYDRKGQNVEIVGEDLLAVALVHEIDHLNGKLYTDIVEGDLWRIEE